MSNETAYLRQALLQMTLVAATSFPREIDRYKIRARISHGYKL